MIWQYVVGDIVHAVRANHMDARKPYVQIWCSPFDFDLLGLEYLIQTDRPVTCLGCIDKMEWW